MARMNKEAPKTGKPRTRQADTHSSATREAHESGLVAWAAKHYDSGLAGEEHARWVKSMAARAKGRRLFERARAASARM